MKKKSRIIVWSLMSFLVLALSGVGVLMFLKFRPNQTVYLGAKTDVTWYDEEGTEFVIDTVDELYDLLTLSQFYDFKGQTIKLGADIVVNEGNAEDWAKDAPKRTWYPISNFNGTFDGQGHSISGLYGRGIDGSVGMFTDTGKKCVIKNLRLVNSYFTSFSNGGTGSIVGTGSVTLDTVYSNAIVCGTRSNIGGIIGKVEGAVDSSITNCWFDGKVSLTTDQGFYGGGIIGIARTMVTMEHCLNTGSVYGTRPSGGIYIGGLCGNFTNGNSYKITDCLNLGKIDSEKAKTYMGSVFGRLDGAADIYFTDTYTSIQSCTGGMGSVRDTSDTYGYCGLVQEKSLTGVEAYRWTTLDFDNYWTLVEDGTPVLRVFAKELMSVPEGLTRAFSVAWYDKGAKESVIMTKEDLYGFYILASSTTFKDTVIKLGADIVVNAGTASTWGSNAPQNQWIPIKKFAGTFDGQGHTISGLYVKSDEKKAGFIAETTAQAVIKNLSIKNSYFENTIGTTALMGSVAGVGRGIFDTIYSDAILVCDGAGCGGIAAQVISSEISRFTNCWFAGSVTLTGENGRYGGGILGLAKEDSTIEHCLNTGTIVSNAPKGAAYTGGMCGYMSNGFTYNITDCLNAGTVEIPFTKTWYGAVFGRVDRESTVNLSNVYITTESCKVVPGSVKVDSKVNGVALKLTEKDILGNDGYKWTTLDFKNYWAVAEGGTPVLRSFGGKAPSGVQQMVDVSWYNGVAKKYTIDSVQDFYGFYLLSGVTDFAGETIALGADITINEGDASTWGINAPQNLWTPIKKFAGTFDGQDHTIRGIYMKTSTGKAGIFAETTQDAVVKKLSIRNSYFESTVGSTGGSNAILGSVAGVGRGKFSAIYSDAILVADAAGCGGIVGQLISTDISLFTNCWFDGSVTMSGKNARYGGGILGIAKADSTIWHCLNTGSITTDVPDGGAYIGGICGYMTNGYTYTIRDTMNSGSVTPTGTKTYYGAIFGRVDKKTTINAINSYAVSEACSVVPGAVSADAKYTGIAVKVSKKQITGYDGYKWTTLDFDNYWTVVADDTPVLSSFAQKVDIPETETRMITVSWYDQSSKQNTIDSEKDLYGLYLISVNENFEGKTILVDKDIKINGGTPSSSKTWTPIGTQEGTTSVKAFAGTFDGQGHTISGIYVKTGKTYAGLFGQTASTATIKNLSVKNSYFESTSTGNALLGSIAGRGAGTFLNLYSNAQVVSTGGYCGGLIGQISTDGTSVTGSWFAGSLSLTGDSGRYGGGIVGEIRCAVEMGNCLNTGTVTADNNKNEPCIGGFVGQLHLNSATLFLRDSLNVGEVKATGKMLTYVGSVIGHLNTNTDATIVNTYVTEESCGQTLGSYEKAEFVNGGAVLVSKDDIQGYDGYEWTTLDFEKFWAVDESGTPILKYFASRVPGLKGRTQKVDISWYDGVTQTTEAYVIDSAEDLYGLYLLSTSTNFAGKKIHLGADIVVNKGTPDDWSKEPPANTWHPIRTFAGEFNGADPETGKIHTISGIYAKDSKNQMGLFAETTDRAVVKNLRLVDSYFESTIENGKDADIGSIAGLGHGTFEAIYSNAYVVSDGNNAGGLVGLISGDAQFTDCWNEGNVRLTGAAMHAGGLAGRIMNAKVLIRSFYNSGRIECENGDKGCGYLGGIAGRISNTSDVTIMDSLNVGTITKTGSASTYLCAIFGRLNKGCTATISDTYASKAGNATPCRAESGAEINGVTNFGSGNTVYNTFITMLDATNLQGSNAPSKATGLSFTDKGKGIHWVAGKGDKDFPALECFQSKYLHQ